MVSQYLSELDKKYRANAYSTLKDLQAEHTSLRSLLKEIEPIFEEKVKSLIENSKSKIQLTSNKNVQMLNLEHYKIWLTAYRHRKHLQYLSSHLTSTASTKTQLLEILSQQSVGKKSSAAEDSQQTQSLKDTLHSDLQILERLKHEYEENRQYLDSRNRGVMTGSSPAALEGTLKTLQQSMKFEEERYTALLQSSESLSSQLSQSKAELQQLRELDPERIEAALNSKASNRVEEYWRLVAKLAQVRQSILRLQQEKLNADKLAQLRLASLETEKSQFQSNISKQHELLEALLQARQDAASKIRTLVEGELSPKKTVMVDTVAGQTSMTEDADLERADLPLDDRTPPQPS